MQTRHPDPYLALIEAERLKQDLEVEGYPEFVSHDELEAGKTYFTAALGNTGTYQLTGPLIPTLPITEITKSTGPFNGQFAADARFTEDGEEKVILIPANGHASVYGVRYTLHEYTPENFSYFVKANRIALKHMRMPV